MTGANLYWPIYKNLEKDLLTVAECIHFSDDQTEVYSMRIADLIIRCSIEIEDISKQLYLQHGGPPSPIDDHGKKRFLYFDTDCLDFLERQWKLSQKQVMVSAPTLYFSKKTNRIIAPLRKANKRGTSGSKWKQAYQAVKHNRTEALKKANVSNLMHAMGALFVLNLYYRNEVFDMGRAYMGTNEFDSSVGSDVFSVFTYGATSISMSPFMDDSCIVEQKDNDLNRSLYIIKYADKSFRQMYENSMKDNEITVSNFRRSSEIAGFLQRNPDYKVESINQTCIDAGGFDLLRKISSFRHTKSNKDIKMEAIVNKDEPIYPTLAPV